MVNSQEQVKQKKIKCHTRPHPVVTVLGVDNDRFTMSHSVTVTRTVTTSSGSMLVVNTGFLSTVPGLLKLAELLLGAACVGVIAYYWDYTYYSTTKKAELFYFLMSVAFLIGTFSIFLSYLVSLSTASFMSKTVFEVIYHGLGFVLYLAASLTLVIEISHRQKSSVYDAYLAASIMGFVMAALYLLSAFFGNRSYRGVY